MDPTDNSLQPGLIGKTFIHLSRFPTDLCIPKENSPLTKLELLPKNLLLQGNMVIVKYS